MRQAQLPSHFIDEEIKAPRGKAICEGSRLVGGIVGIQIQAVSVVESLEHSGKCNPMSDQHRIPEFLS